MTQPTTPPASPGEPARQEGPTWPEPGTASASSAVRTVRWPRSGGAGSDGVPDPFGVASHVPLGVREPATASDTAPATPSGTDTAPATPSGTDTAAPSPVPAPGGPAKPAGPGRDRYLDLLRATALVRVVFYHVFGWAWLSIVFPSMGVMFALAGSLMARSLARPALGVLRGRLRRLLPPMWAFSAVVVTMLIAGGWGPGKEGAGWFVRLATYIVPVGAPPYPFTLGHEGGWLETSWPDEAAGPLWYLRAYLWFVLASPLLLKAFRKFPLPTLLAPVALAAVITTGLVDIPGETGLALADFATYGGCWVLGFAYHDGVLQKIPRYLAVSLSAIVMAFALWWASGHQGEDGWDFNDIPLAQCVWSLGFVAILLQYAPSWKQLPRRLRRFDRIITLFNNRAVTIYLWHNGLLLATGLIIDRAWDLPFMNDRLSSLLDTTYTTWMFVLVWPLLSLVILAVGWVEDVAARRRPRLWPDGRKERLQQNGGAERAGGVESAGGAKPAGAERVVRKRRGRRT
ncbi:acyltransferase family protein [Streptomyces tsukubensis]|uniref:acyltransferase family protein n=1 Tax=Streptomyces tsukubensis TaxID=83656 RepID=UPI000990092A|nr:acyltransferase [Streptomyces tsukubensis]QFR93888.1 acyltransferase family protein [Streptomyces tsukubensis]